MTYIIKMELNKIFLQSKPSIWFRFKQLFVKSKFIGICIHQGFDFTLLKTFLNTINAYAAVI